MFALSSECARAACCGPAPLPVASCHHDVAVVCCCCHRLASPYKGRVYCTGVKMQRCIKSQGTVVSSWLYLYLEESPHYRCCGRS